VLINFGSTGLPTVVKGVSHLKVGKTRRGFAHPAIIMLLLQQLKSPYSPRPDTWQSHGNSDNGKYYLLGAIAPTLSIYSATVGNLPNFALIPMRRMTAQKHAPQPNLHRLNSIDLTLAS